MKSSRSVYVKSVNELLHYVWLFALTLVKKCMYLFPQLRDWPEESFSLAGYNMWRRKAQTLPRRSKQQLFWAQCTTAPGQTGPEGCFHLLLPILFSLYKVVYISPQICFYFSLPPWNHRGSIFQAIESLKLYLLVLMILSNKIWVYLLWFFF